ncbi:hypothetical protein ASJ35_17295 [Ruthenibacterium lactatiformans]|uniref:Uncharacterized protein n=1 Tax=Ruthenibacterium lactatiformans TaxID=1550024 RepID=A0A0W7TM43_9FIRM|nr:hypothetical protein ASJ35_17295 [Ruthenibacterium lactatiformans]
MAASKKKKRKRLLNRAILLMDELLGKLKILKDIIIYIRLGILIHVTLEAHGILQKKALENLYGMKFYLA